MGQNQSTVQEQLHRDRSLRQDRQGRNYPNNIGIENPDQVKLVSMELNHVVDCMNFPTNHGSQLTDF